MKAVSTYTSALGEILLAAEEDALCGLWFDGQRFYARGLDGTSVKRETPVLTQTKRWLDAYFSGLNPGPRPALTVCGTPFQRRVCTCLLEIPYGTTCTYGALAARIAPNLSAQAVGAAAARNPVSVLIPCHRLIGADGSLKGYAGGLWRKATLLALERDAFL